MLRTTFKGLRPAETISALFIPWTAGERTSDQRCDEVIGDLESGEKVEFDPLVRSKGNNPYLRRLLDIRMYLDVDLVLRHGCGALDRHDGDPKEFTGRVRNNGERAMREYCDEISKLESENVATCDKQEEISKTYTGSIVKILKDDENYLRWFLDYTLYNYVMQQLKELDLLEKFKDNETQNLDGLTVREKFIHTVLRRGKQALKEFDGDDNDEKEEKDDNPKCKVAKISQPEADKDDN